METFKGAEVAPINELLGRTHFVRALLAQLAEAQRLLDAANAELHELRIRAGLGEGGPDWSQAPEWAQWWAADESGEAYWYEKEPSLLIHDGMWNNREGQAIRSFPAVSWYVSLRQRPGQPAAPRSVDDTTA